MKKFIKFMVAVCICGLFFIVGFFSYVIYYTPAGASFLLRTAASFYFPSASLTYNIEGDLARGITFKNMEFVDLELVPAPNILRVQNFYIKVDGLGLSHVMAYIQNARLNFPDTDPIVTTMHLEDGLLTGNLHTRVLVSDDLFWLPKLIPKNLDIETRMGNIDFDGSFDEFVLRGSFDVDRVQREDLVFRDSACRFDLTVKDLHAQPISLYGEVVFGGGPGRAPDRGGFF
jgi:hypothetical protein